MTNENEVHRSEVIDGEHPEAPKAEKLAKLITELGVGWAKYGLTIGRLALQQSARTLESTSELLGEIAVRVEKTGERVASKV